MRAADQQQQWWSAEVQSEAKQAAIGEDYRASEVSVLYFRSFNPGVAGEQVMDIAQSGLCPARAVTVHICFTCDLRKYLGGGESKELGFVEGLDFQDLWTRTSADWR